MRSDRLRSLGDAALVERDGDRELGFARQSGCNHPFGSPQQHEQYARIAELPFALGIAWDENEVSRSGGVQAQKNVTGNGIREFIELQDHTIELRRRMAQSSPRNSKDLVRERRCGVSAKLTLTR